jgi:hypothetical protein
MTPGFGLVMMLACAVFYHRLGVHEGRSGIADAAVSLGLWLGAEMLLGLGWVGCLLLQLVPFAAMTLRNLARKGRGGGAV